MPRLVMVAKVEDATEWQERFRSHRELFSTIYGEMGMNVIHFTTTSDNEAVLYSEPPDLEAYFATLESPEIQAAMAEDGVDRASVRVYVLDKELTF